MMDCVLNLTANGFEDLDTQLPDLIASIVDAGGWIMASAISPEGAVHTRFEFERKDCVEIYAAMMASGLELSRNSHSLLVQLSLCRPAGLSQCGCEATNVQERIYGSGSALVDLNILPSQVDDFDRLPEKTTTPVSLIGTSSA